MFREENTMLPMLTFAVAVAIWTPITITACKWVADARKIASGSLILAKGVSEKGLKAIQDP